MTTPSIDASRYLHCPRVGIRSGLSLGRMLLAAVPDDPPPSVLATMHELSLAVDELASRWDARERRRSVDVRPYDYRLDRIYAAVHHSLARYAVLGADHPDRPRAAELHALLFPTGLSFTQLPYLEQHAESSRRIALIEDEGLRDDLDALVGKAFIDELLAAHEAYGVALDITEAGEHRPTSLAPPLRALTRAISSYALQVVAFAALDPDNVAVARRALEPIDAVRRSNARRWASHGETEAEFLEEPNELDAALGEPPIDQSDEATAESQTTEAAPEAMISAA